MKGKITAIIVAGFVLLVAVPAFAAWNYLAQQQLPEGQDMSQDVQNKTNTLLDIMRGTYTGPSDVRITFSEDELNNIILPEINRRVEEKDMLVGFSLDQAIIPDGMLEISGRIMGRKTVDFSVQVGAMQRNGKIKLELNNVKYNGEDVPREKLDQIIRMKGMKPENMMIGLRNFRLDDLRIMNKQVMISGTYMPEVQQ